jgi:hypothetical protein
MDRSGGIGCGDVRRWGSQCGVYPGYACEDGYAVAVFYYDVTGWWDVVYM